MLVKYTVAHSCNSKNILSRYYDLTMSFDTYQLLILKVTTDGSAEVCAQLR